VRCGVAAGVDGVFSFGADIFLRALGPPRSRLSRPALLRVASVSQRDTRTVVCMKPGWQGDMWLLSRRLEWQRQLVAALEHAGFLADAVGECTKFLEQDVSASAVHRLALTTTLARLKARLARQAQRDSAELSLSASQRTTTSADSSPARGTQATPLMATRVPVVMVRVAVIPRSMLAATATSAAATKRARTGVGSLGHGGVAGGEAAGDTGGGRPTKLRRLGGSSNLEGVAPTVPQPEPGMMDDVTHTVDLLVPACATSVGPQSVVGGADCISDDTDVAVAADQAPSRPRRRVGGGVLTVYPTVAPAAGVTGTLEDGRALARHRTAVAVWLASGEPVAVNVERAVMHAVQCCHGVGSVFRCAPLYTFADLPRAAADFAGGGLAWRSGSGVLDCLEPTCTRPEGWRSIHGENRVWRALFALLLWEQLYARDYVPDVWRVEALALPLDMYHGTLFWEHRREALSKRLEKIRSMSPVELGRHIAASHQVHAWVVVLAREACGALVEKD